MKTDQTTPLLPDYHIHTPLCHHATGDEAEYLEAARAGGIPEICFTDHSPNPDGYDPAHRMEMSEFHGYCARVASLGGAGPPEVLLGIEADYYEGCETFLRTWLPSGRFDYVIGSVHYLDNWGFDNPAERTVWDSVDIGATWEKYFQLLGRMVGSGLFDAVGHLDLPKKFGYRPPDADLKEMVRPLLDRIATAGMGIELNTSGLRRPVAEIYPSPLILSMAFKRDIPICFGSDAHRPEEVGTGFASALMLAKSVGYTHAFRIRRRRKTSVLLP